MNPINADSGESVEGTEFGTHADFVPDTVGKGYGIYFWVTVLKTTEFEIEAFVGEGIPSVARHASNADDRAEGDHHLRWMRIELG